MIAYISGKILDVNDHSVLILTQSGIGYELLISAITFANISAREEIELFVYHHITENSQALFAFETLDDKRIFLELIKISGIGGRVALQILSLGKNRLISAVQNDDNKTIEGIKGIGKKMAEKVILELKDKDFVKKFTGETYVSQKSPEQILLPKSLRENIASTLQNMGYQSRDIERVMSEIPEEFSSLEEILPFMIRALS